MTRRIIFTASLAFAVGHLFMGVMSVWSQTAPLRVPAQEAVRQQSKEPPPVRIAERFGPQPLAALSPASVGAKDQLKSLRAWNATGLLPVRVGFVRPLPLPRFVDFGDLEKGAPAGAFSGGAFVRSPSDALYWGTEVRVESAYRLRLHLADVHLPPGTKMWVYDATGAYFQEFGLELEYEDELWTPSVPGPALRFEIALPIRNVSGKDNFTAPQLTLDSIAEVVRPVLASDALGTVNPKADTSPHPSR